jgi:DNA-binding response OmpR family regulator
LTVTAAIAPLPADRSAAARSAAARPLADPPSAVRPLDVRPVTGLSRTDPPRAELSRTDPPRAVRPRGTAPTGAGRPVRLLVVEDDRVIAGAVVQRLSSTGYQVDAVHDGTAAIEAAAAHRYGAVILDRMLPGTDGLEVCRRIQERDPVPVLMLTALDAEADRITGLGAGADDYLTKPFSPRELVARVAALLRRVDRATALAEAALADEAEIVAGALRIDPARRRVSVDGADVHLTRTEFDLLHALARRVGRAVGRAQLLTEVWDWADATTARASLGTAARAVDSHVKALRRKVGGHRIRTVHGVGYALEALP